MAIMIETGIIQKAPIDFSVKSKLLMTIQSV